MTTRWTDRYAQRTQKMTSSAIREILKITQMPNVISFAGGMPAPELFPVAEIEAAAHKVLTEHGPASLQYSTTEGYAPLRQFLVDQMARYGIVTGVDNVLITNGSQQGLDLIGKIFIDEGDVVLVEDPSYLGAIQAWTPYGATYATIPMDDQGMRMDVLETMLAEKRPKFIYALPNFQNPTGVTRASKWRNWSMMSRCRSATNTLTGVAVRMLTTPSNPKPFNQPGNSQLQAAESVWRISKSDGPRSRCGSI